jgi:hypothetical protein
MIAPSHGTGSFGLGLGCFLLLMLQSAGLFTGCDPHRAGPSMADSTAVALLADLHIAKAREDLYGSAPEGVRDSILANYGLDSTSFEGILDYYAEEPDHYAIIYADVLDFISESWNTRPKQSQISKDTLATPTR